MPYSKIRSFLDAYSRTVWGDVTVARSTRIVPFGEVGVTDRLHLAMIRGAMAGSARATRTRPRLGFPNELVTGADWEWVIQLPGTPGVQPEYLIYRIQAKILHRITGTRSPAVEFTGLGHPGRSGSQMTNLIDAAATVNALPFYCFYIGDPWPSTSPIPCPISCPTWPPGVNYPPREDFGATVVPARSVRHVYRTHSAAPAAAEANQYLTVSARTGYDYNDMHFGAGRRLSDLFPQNPGATGGGGPDGGGPDGGGPDGGGRPTPEPNGQAGGDDSDGQEHLSRMATDLSAPEQAPYRDEIEQIRQIAANETGSETVSEYSRTDTETPGRPETTFYLLLETAT